MNDLKIFELKFTKQGEKEWICARTNIEALIVYTNYADVHICEFDNEDEIIEIPKEKWGEYKIRNTEYNKNDPEDWETKTFEQYMKTQITRDIIAGTMYE